MKLNNQIINGDCIDILHQIPEKAGYHKKTYSRYIKWLIIKHIVF